MRALQTAPPGSASLQQAISLCDSFVEGDRVALLRQDFAETDRLVERLGSSICEAAAPLAPDELAEAVEQALRSLAHRPTLLPSLTLPPSKQCGPF